MDPIKIPARRIKTNFYEIRKRSRTFPLFYPIHSLFYFFLLFVNPNYDNELSHVLDKVSGIV